MSRMTNASRNGMVTLIFFVITTLLSFFSRKIMLDCLGTDLLGLNTALNAIIDFMLLMELGVTSAIGVSLYKPLAEGNRERINEIMWLIRYLYRILAGGILTVGILLSPLLPYLIEKSDVTFAQTYIAYFVFLICSAASYYFGYGRVLFQADQRNYIPVTISNTVLISKTLAQIFAVSATRSYWLWLVIELIFQVGAHYGVKLFLYRKYPSLEPDIRLSLKELVKKYKDIFADAKLLAVHQLSGFVLRQSNNIVIATMINLSTVAFYGNYYMINGALNNVMWNVLQNAWAGVGNLVATESRKRIYAVYKEYLSANFFINMVANLCILFLIEDFIRVWLGEQYLISYSIVVAMVGMNFIGSFTNASAAFITAYKLFGYIIVPIAEAVVNIVLSVVGAYYFGLLGVILGSIGATLISAVWKPIYLHRCGFCLPVRIFVLYVLKMCVLAGVALFVIYYGAVKSVRLLFGQVENMGEWIVIAVLLTLLIAFILGITMYAGDNNFRVFVGRLLKLIKKRI